MLAAPSIAIALPLKILVWAGRQGKVWVSYNNPAYVQGRHSLPPQNIAGGRDPGIESDRIDWFRASRECIRIQKPLVGGSTDGQPGLSSCATPGS
jgi:Domain of unknown function DUF302